MRKYLNLIISVAVMLVLGILFVVIAKFAIPSNQMEKIYGANYKVTADAEFETSSIIYKKENVKGTKVNGSIYYLTYAHDFTVASGTIEIKLAVDENEQILGYELLKYEHTNTPDTNFMNKAINYLDSYLNTKIEDIKLTHEKNLSLSAGATESSVNTIYVMLESLRKALSTDPYADYFGEYVVESDANFTPNEIVISKEIVTGDTNGFIYVGEKTHSFVSEAGYPVAGNIKIKLVLDEAGVILEYEFLEYEHTKGGYQNRIISYLDSFIGTRISNAEQTHILNLSSYAGSSETGEHVIYPILNAIREANE